MIVKDTMICAFAGNVSMLGIMIIFPQFLRFLSNIPQNISILLGITLLMAAVTIVECGVSK